MSSMSANSGSLASEEVSIRVCGKHNPEVNQDPRNLKTGQQKPQLKNVFNVSRLY